MKAVIIYKGRYGATKQYAEWLQEDLRIPAVCSDDVTTQLSGSDIVILGSSVYIGKLELAKWLKRNLDTLRGKKLLFFVVCGTHANETEKLESYLATGIPKEMRSDVDAFYLPGRLDIGKLTWLDRFMLKMGAQLAKDPQVKKEMLTDYNDVKRQNLAALIQKYNSYMSVPQL
jgi:menaquinone-dependent protoporphyrinogen IX oxidase